MGSESGLAILIGAFFDSVIWGFYVTSLGFCMHALLVSKKVKNTENFNWRMASVSWILFIFGTFDVTLVFYHVFQATRSANVGMALAVFEQSDWRNLARTVCVVFQTVIGDAVLIYRCWIVYQRSMLVIIPSLLLWIGLFGTTIWILVVEATLDVAFNSDQTARAITTFWSITITFNVITTSLLVYRIWSVDHANRKHQLEVVEYSGGSRLNSIKNIIVESGLLYTISAVGTFGTYISGSDFVYLMSWAEVQVVGIAFNLIIVRTSYLSRSWQAVSGAGSGRTKQIAPLKFNLSTINQNNANSQLEMLPDTEEAARLKASYEKRPKYEGPSEGFQK